MILAIHFMLTAQAGELDVFPLKGDFGPADLEGRDGWVGGYAADPWPMYGDGDDVTSGTDDGAAGSKWGVGDAMDNWLVQSDLVTVGQGGVESNFQNLDSDCAGIVFSGSAGGNLYLAFWSQDQAPPPVDTVGSEQIQLLRVENGSAASVGKKTVNLDMNKDHLLRLDRNGTTVSVSLDGTSIITFEDLAPLPAGLSGFYAYQDGSVWGDDSTVYFEDVRMFQFDDDADTIPDDLDNCELIVNTDQADQDLDGVGNVCDPDFVDDPGTEPGTTGDADTDVDSDSDADTDADGDPNLDGDNDPSTMSGEVLKVTSGCDTSGGASWLGVLAVFAAFGLRRRS